MAEVNNAIALSIKSPDIGETLMKAGQINYLRANTAKTQQDIDYNQRLQDQGQDGMRPQEQNTLAEAHQKQMGLAGQIGNMIYNDQSLATRKQAIQSVKNYGIKIEPDMERHILTIPAAQLQQYGMNLRNASMPASSNMEATGETTANQGRFMPQGIPPNEPIISRTQAAGGLQGFVTNNPMARNPAAMGGPPSAPPARASKFRRRRKARARSQRDPWPVTIAG